jgi:hypothetical protein
VSCVKKDVQVVDKRRLKSGVRDVRLTSQVS